MRLQAAQHMDVGALAGAQQRIGQLAGHSQTRHLGHRIECAEQAELVEHALEALGVEDAGGHHLATGVEHQAQAALPAQRGLCGRGRNHALQGVEQFEAGAVDADGQVAYFRQRKARCGVEEQVCAIAGSRHRPHLLAAGEVQHLLVEEALELIHRGAAAAVGVGIAAQGAGEHCTGHTARLAIDDEVLEHHTVVGGGGGDDLVGLGVGLLRRNLADGEGPGRERGDLAAAATAPVGRARVAGIEQRHHGHARRHLLQQAAPFVVHQHVGAAFISAHVAQQQDFVLAVGLAAGDEFGNLRTMPGKAEHHRVARLGTRSQLSPGGKDGSLGGGGIGEQPHVSGTGLLEGSRHVFGIVHRTTQGDEALAVKARRVFVHAHHHGIHRRLRGQGRRERCGQQELTGAHAHFLAGAALRRTLRMSCQRSCWV